MAKRKATIPPETQYDGVGNFDPDKFVSGMLNVQNVLKERAAEERRLQAEALAAALAAKPSAKPKSTNRRSVCPHCREKNSTVYRTYRKSPRVATQYLLCHSCERRWDRPKAD